MILTNCAACAAPLAHNAPRCVRCHTRYCNATCQHTNDAFAALGSTVDDLLNPENKAALTNILLYHVVPGTALSTVPAGSFSKAYVGKWRCNSECGI